MTSHFHNTETIVQPRLLSCRGKRVILGERTLIMGILNVTPDSFSDGGHYVTVETAVERAVELESQGADMIDIGGESTRPGYTPISAEEEIKRIVPVIEAVSLAVNVPISVDTYKAAVANAALEAGAHIVNDIWGLKHDPEMGQVIEKYSAAVVLMHNRKQIDYTDFVPDVLKDLQASISLAHTYGISDEQIMVDPGIGFAKTTEQNLLLMNQLDKIATLGYPVLLGTSRKSMIWKTLQRTPADVLEGTIATVVFGMMLGCQIVRVHDVAAVKQAAQMTDILLRYGKE